jgi:dihydropyrimidinase
MDTGRYVSADSFASGTVAAALGGTTTVIDFVVPQEGQRMAAALAARRREADGHVAIDYGLHMTIPTWHASHPETLGELPAMVADGVPTFKLYMAYAGYQLDDGQLYQALKAVAEAGGLPIVHCENGPVCEALRAEAVARGDTGPINHALTRPPRQEAEAVGRAIDIAALANSPLYVVHVSAEGPLSRIREARQRGEPVLAETCPQYLLLNQLPLEQSGGERLICAPPLRPKRDSETLWGGLLGGDVDVLATDHCPFTSAEKAGHADFTTIPGGLPSIEARLSLAHHFGRLRGTSLQRWVEVCCAEPARIFGLQTKGQIEPGFDADLVVFDPERKVTLQAGETLHEHVDWSPYEGVHVKGWPRDVFSRGEMIVREGEYVGQAGRGRFIERELR